MTILNRNQCVVQIQKFGWPVPYKSRCWICPNQSSEACKQMKKLGNGDFEKAVELEKTVRRKDGDLYFHKLRLPL